MPGFNRVTTGSEAALLGLQRQKAEKKAAKKDRALKTARKAAKNKPEKPAKQDPSEEVLATWKKAFAKPAPPAAADSATGAKPKKITNKSFKEQFVVFIGQLPYTVTSDQVASHITKLASLAAPPPVRMLTDKASGESRGMAFATLPDLESTTKVLALHNSLLGGRRMVVERSAVGRKAAPKKSSLAGEAGSSAGREKLNKNLKRRHEREHKQYIQHLLETAVKSAKNAAGGKIVFLDDDDDDDDHRHGETRKAQVGGRLFELTDLDAALMVFLYTVPKGVAEQAIDEFLVHLRHAADEFRPIKSKAALLTSIVKRLHKDTDTVKQDYISTKCAEKLERAQARRLSSALPRQASAEAFKEKLDPFRKTIAEKRALAEKKALAADKKRKNK